jgi:hypothetical protein
MTILDERYPRGFVGNTPNFESNFLENTDDEKRFLKNCETQPSDWIYRNKKITYKYNEYGHRCVSPNQLKPGYILYMGCISSKQKNNILTSIPLETEVSKSEVNKTEIKLNDVTEFTDSKGIPITVDVTKSLAVIKE